MFEHLGQGFPSLPNIFNWSEYLPDWPLRNVKLTTVVPCALMDDCRVALISLHNIKMFLIGILFETVCG